DHLAAFGHRSASSPETACAPSARVVSLQPTTAPTPRGGVGRATNAGASVVGTVSVLGLVGPPAVARPGGAARLAPPDAPPGGAGREAVGPGDLRDGVAEVVVERVEVVGLPVERGAQLGPRLVAGAPARRGDPGEQLLAPEGRELLALQVVGRAV